MDWETKMEMANERIENEMYIDYLKDNIKELQNVISEINEIEKEYQEIEEGWQVRIVK